MRPLALVPLSLIYLLVLLIGMALRPMPAQAQTESVLYSFCSMPNCTDGAWPIGGLVLDTQGNLYGTTAYAGAYGYGTVFAVTSAGTETVIYSFAGKNKKKTQDGGYPNAGLVLDAQGNLYGTTVLGGTKNKGTVFKVASTGTETVLYSFTGGGGGRGPYAGLVIDPGGNLYGTTLGGGRAGGTVFEVTQTGNEMDLLDFSRDGQPDGTLPYAGLVLDAHGNLYGTTSAGGVSGYEGTGRDKCPHHGCGTVFELSPALSETVLYQFKGLREGDGADPYTAGLVMDAMGNLYGTTTFGGTYGYGTVFEVTPSGTEKVLHSFGEGGPADGVYPFAGVIVDAQGNLYGTTDRGGAYGAGTVFEVTATGEEQVLYSFGEAPNDGGGPYAGLVMDSQGNLYGTTVAGGAYGEGVVFKLTP